MKIKRKQMVMLVLLAVFAALLVVTIITGGKETNGEYTMICPTDSPMPCLSFL